MRIVERILQVMRNNTAKKRAAQQKIFVNNAVSLFKRRNSKFYSAEIWEEREAITLTIELRTADLAAATALATNLDLRINAELDNDDSTTTIAQDKRQTRVAQRKICNGNVVLFKRRRSRKWQCKVRRSVGRWLDYTTGTDDFEEAKKIAEEKYRDIKYRQETGKVDITKRFRDVCLVAKRQLEAEYKKTGRTQLNDKVRVIDKYLIPILGTYNTHNITDKALLEFNEQREQLVGRRLSKSTIKTHNSALNYVFELAKKHNYIVEVPSLSNTGAASEKQRLHFNNKEYRKLCANMWRDLDRSKKLLNKNGLDGKGKLSQRSYEIRELLRDVVLILVNTGIRAGNELLKLKWNNVSIETDRNGNTSIAFNLIKAKTRKHRKVISYEAENKNDTDTREGSWKCLERIKDRFEDLRELSLEECFKREEYIFRFPSTDKVVKQEILTKNFKALLKRCDLLKDEFGNDRVLYSLRHTYASRRRFEGMSFDDLALQMGTSVKLLEDVYSHFETTQKPELYSGQASRQRRKKEDSVDQRMRMLEGNVEALVEQNAQLMKMLAEK